MGIGYYIYCDLTNDLYSVYVLDYYTAGTEWGERRDPGGDLSNFIGQYMNTPKYKTNMERVIASTYFSFTSLSTVGFGDLHPLNSYERALTSLVLLFGVAVFSIVMGNFIEISDSFMSMNEEFDDGDNLSKFFGLLKKFNKGQSIQLEMKNNMEEFFDYRWRNDKNQSISTEEDKDMV